MDSRFPDFQHLGPEERVRMWQELWSGIFLFLNLGAVDLALRRDSNWASTATSTITGNLKTWVSARPSVQTLATLHWKWTTVLAIFQNASFFTYHLCTLIHALYFGVYSSGSSPVRTLPFPQYPRQMLSTSWVSLTFTFFFFNFMLCCCLSFSYLCIAYLVK